MFTLTIKTENEAFGDSPAHEVARILRQIANRLEDGTDSAKVMDVNGNSVGHFDLTTEQEA